MRKTTSGARVARARKITGETAESFADMIGKSVATLRSWESGRLDLGEDSALRISLETGCAYEWLLFGSGDPWTAQTEEPFTLESYAAWRKALKRGNRPQKYPDPIATSLELADLFATICAAVASAEKTGMRDLAIRRIAGFASQMGKNFLTPAGDETAKATWGLTKNTAEHMLNFAKTFMSQPPAHFRVSEQDEKWSFPSAPPAPSSRASQDEQKTKRQRRLR